MVTNRKIYKIIVPVNKMENDYSIKGLENFKKFIEEAKEGIEDSPMSYMEKQKYLDRLRNEELEYFRGKMEKINERIGLENKCVRNLMVHLGTIKDPNFEKYLIHENVLEKDYNKIPIYLRN